MKAILRWTAALYLFCVSTLAIAGNKLPNISFWVGYDEPWSKGTPSDINYGTWLASNPVYGVGSNFAPNFVNQMFNEMARGKAKIVRIWLFPALQGIQSPTIPNTPTTNGLTSEFLTNLGMVLDHARQNHQQVYITALNGGDMKGVVGYAPLQTYFTNLLLNTNNEREKFKSNALAPVLDFLTNYNNNNKGVIYAFELINEIEAPLSAGYFPTYWWGARSWIQNMTAFIKTKQPNHLSWSWLPVTSSAGYGYAVQDITFGLFSGLGLDFYDVHVYSDSGTYSGQTALCNKVKADGVQIVLGEYGQTSQTSNDSLQSSATGQFLYRASTSCFSAALAWKYEATSQTWLTYRCITPPGTQPGALCTYPSGNFYRPAYTVIQTFGASSGP